MMQPPAPPPALLSGAVRSELLRLKKDARWLDALDRLEEEQFYDASDPLCAEIESVGGRFREAQRELAEGGRPWEEGHSYAGIATKFRYDDDGTLWLSTEGVMEHIELYYTVSVIREVELFGEWVPLIRFVEVLRQVDFSRLCTHFAVGVPLVLVRDCLLECAACNAALRDSSLYFAGKTPPQNEDAEGGVVLPARTRGFAFDRMTVLALHARIEFVSATSQRVKVVAAVDLRLRLPRTLLDFLMKRLVGVFLLLWRRQSRAIAKDPTCPHRIKIERDTDFYKDWLWPKYLAFLKTKGWQLPSCPAFEDHTTLEPTAPPTDHPEELAAAMIHAEKLEREESQDRDDAEPREGK
mmetsp:Transcript_4642/g.15391  ORF Transcript_4642/g.15391 Transcript_4642/m.15391 type:complete len:353 (-) Transcript_4642:129-1187(-)